MSDENGGPRVWNRADVAAVMGFLKLGHWAGDVTRLMEYIETFDRRPDGRHRRAPKLVSALNDTEKQAGPVAGGRARAEALTPERRSEIARKAAEARWGKASA